MLKVQENYIKNEKSDYKQKYRRIGQQKRNPAPNNRKIRIKQT